MLRRVFVLCLSLAWMACGWSAERPQPPRFAAAQAEAGRVPEQALRVLREVRARGRAPEGIEGGRHFGNFEHRLPDRDGGGRTIRYQEWDLWPKVRGRNRGPERLVTGSDGRAWYTGDHYRTFVEVRP